MHTPVKHTHLTYTCTSTVDELSRTFYVFLDNMKECIPVTCFFLQFSIKFFFWVSTAGSFKTRWTFLTVIVKCLTHCSTNCRKFNFLFSSFNMQSAGKFMFSQVHFLMLGLTIDCCFVCFLLSSSLCIFPCMLSMSQWFIVFSAWWWCSILPLPHANHSSPIFHLCNFWFPLHCIHCVVAQEIILQTKSSCSAHIGCPYTP